MDDLSGEKNGGSCWIRTSGGTAYETVAMGRSAKEPKKWLRETESNTLTSSL